MKTKEIVYLYKNNYIIQFTKRSYMISNLSKTRFISGVTTYNKAIKLIDRGAML